MKSFPIRLQQDGTIAVPKLIQDKLNLHEGDWLNLLEIEDVIILTSKQPKVPQLTEQITAIREEEKISLEELLEGLENERKIIYKEKYE
ncbi:AbrB family transcriptional regulator [Cyanothece sp. BG0011]|uniref:AbrB family transcriptional regulator n=1 Tax=Cyanothece sp. BG0011 TaxID=2082950 RepID=UPI000D1DD556|nr:AbrB family transcriptional regulator [Cyanothece sp. BG0011]